MSHPETQEFLIFVEYSLKKTNEVSRKYCAVRMYSAIISNSGHRHRPTQARLEKFEKAQGVQSRLKRK